MADFFELSDDGFVDRAILVAVEIGPDRGVRIEVLLAVLIEQHSALALPDDDRLRSEPILHLGEGVPEIFVIQRRELVHGAPYLKRGAIAKQREGSRSGAVFLNSRGAWMETNTWESRLAGRSCRW